jgi:hypothetical protein
MKIFKPLGEEDYELAHPVNSEDFETFNLLVNGVPRRDTWQPVRMKLVTEDEHGRPWRESDAPWLGSDALILRPRAIQALEPLLLANGELLPLECEQTPLAMFNPTHLVDALDEETSEVRRFEDGRIFHIRTHVFRRDIIQSLQAFKIKSLRVSPTYVGEQFVEQWKAAGLRGLTFTPVWEG